MHFCDRHDIAVLFFLISRRDHTKKRILVEWLKRQIACAGRGEKTDINDAVFDPVGDIGISALIDFQLDARVIFSKRMNDIRDPVGADTRKAADFYGTLLEFVDSFDGLMQMLFAAEHRVDVWQQIFPVRG